ncbi:prepilin-type N-terminal cleavage/methylation domain-containing protein [Geotalea sp. SG265]|uniref:prepilin-type N-terminal cleavage/methylation domain-containing protein n=1 Tax=Geotalea sp. SG265 TaxID=2922867 RepID=UPI001FAFD686|nr:prepilin-type N-terminal cleavage/methylation domain-containing protein [Geotalea sp. SG265]
MLRLDNHGYTLTELIIVMAIFMTVIIITANAFEKIVYQSSNQSKSAETQIEGIVGLEVLRADLEQAGFGLPWSFIPAINYTEADGDNLLTATIRPTGKNAGTYNDAPTSAPRAIVSDDSTFNWDGSAGSKYLVIKSSLAAANDTCRKWTTVSFDQYGARTRKIWGSAALDFNTTDRVIIVKNSLNTTPITRQLVSSSTSTAAFSGTFSNFSSPANPQNGDTFEIYGINDSSDALSFPFNRADYYVARPSSAMPKSCADNTGILYKSTVIQGGTSAGKLAPGMPLLDCVADMQVVFGIDASGNGINYADPNYHTTSLSGYDANRIRTELKEIRVYILAQEGKKDRLYTYPSETVEVGERFGGVLQGRVFNLKDRIGADYKNYRWKVYTIVIRPKNLLQ